MLFLNCAHKVYIPIIYTDWQIGYVRLINRVMLFLQCIAEIIIISNYVNRGGMFFERWKCLEVMLKCDMHRRTAGLRSLGFSTHNVSKKNSPTFA